MIDKIMTLESNDTWEFVPLPLGKSIVGYKWVFNVMVTFICCENDVYYPFYNYE